jgi:hypothetical protein
MRIYRFVCRVCRSSYEITADEDPGQQSCPTCPRTTLGWWQTSRPVDAFQKPDTTGVIFGPKLEDEHLAQLEAQRELEGRGDDAYTIKDEEPAEAPVVQLALL